MTKTILEKLRERLGLTRQQMAELLGISRGNVERYEAVLTEDLAAKCLQIARQKKIRDLEAELALLAGEPVPVDDIDLGTATKAEVAYLKKCLRIYRNPKSDLQRGIPQFIEAIYRNHEEDGK